MSGKIYMPNFICQVNFKISSMALISIATIRHSSSAKMQNKATNNFIILCNTIKYLYLQRERLWKGKFPNFYRIILCMQPCIMNGFWIDVKVDQGFAS